jgi:RHS repeat-associated protein
MGRIWSRLQTPPSSGDDCGPAPTVHHQAYSYDDLDRLTSEQQGSYNYNDTNHLHAVTGLSNVANQYATYDAMGNMTCRNVDTSSGHSCSGSNPTGAALSYDNEGRLTSWTAPSGTTASDTFLYDAEGNRVLQSATSGTAVTDTITFDGYTETTISGGTTTTLNYYSLNGQRVAVQQGTNPVQYLVNDLLGSTDVAVNSHGGIVAVQLYWPYGDNEYSWGTMPTTYNFTGQRLDSVTGLLYFNSRYYDPLSGRFTRADTVQTNAQGMDPYAYVGDSPLGKTDPSGHYIADENGDFAYADDQGETRYIKNDPITSGPGYIYTVYRYTWAQIRRPTPKTAPYDRSLTLDFGNSYKKYTGWNGSWGLWGIPLWQNQAIFKDLNYDFTGGIGPSDDGWDIGLATDESLFDATDKGVIGDQFFGLTYAVGITGPEVNGLVGLTGDKIGLEGGINPVGSVHLSGGLNIAEVNISNTASLGLAYQLGFSIGVHGISVSIPYFSDAFSFSWVGMSGS